MLTDWASWVIVAISTLGVVARPFRWPAAVWTVAGAVCLVTFNLLGFSDAARAVAKGADVYLFLAGMMLLAECARHESLFDCAAILAVNHAHGSPRRLLLIVYAVGVVTTTFLSNDATAVLLTPAVMAAAKAAKVRPLPLLFSCAFVANAASFVLPISNPANLVLYGDQMPRLGQWLKAFALPSLVSITVTYAVLRWHQRESLSGVCERHLEPRQLKRTGYLALGGVGVAAIVLTGASAAGIKLGLPTALCGVATVAAVATSGRYRPGKLLKSVSWDVLPLVAGYYVLVAACEKTGVVAEVARWLGVASRTPPPLSSLLAGVSLAVTSNLTNNLPAGLVAGAAVMQAHTSTKVVNALLLGVDLGPNLSITGCLASMLWLSAIRREGEEVGFVDFLKAGALVMLPALVGALAPTLLAGEGAR